VKHGSMIRRRRYRGRRRPPYRSRRWSRPALAAGGAVVVGTAVVVAAMAADGGEVDCVTAVFADRSTSADDDELTAERVAEAQQVVRDATDCEWVVVGTIAGRQGEAEVWVGPLRGRGPTPLDRRDDAVENLAEAEERIEAIFSSPAGGATNYMATLHQIDDQLDGLEGLDADARVEAYLWGDAINTRPVDLYRADLSLEGIGELVASLGPLPPCELRVHFVGVDRGVGRALSPETAEGVERFWRAYVDACGGMVVSYAPTVPVS
jgi:hypothetical protein